MTEPTTLAGALLAAQTAMHGVTKSGRNTQQGDPLVWTDFLDIGDCWTWTRARTGNGYGNVAGRSAHRVIWELLVGPIESGLDLDHLCRNRACVNPDHLEPVTRSVNLARGLRGRPPHRPRWCRRGHDKDDVGRERDGSCRACRRQTWRDHYYRTRSAS